MVRLQVVLHHRQFMSGVVKLTSGDESWWNLTALLYHPERSQTVRDGNAKRRASTVRL